MQYNFFLFCFCFLFKVIEIASIVLPNGNEIFLINKLDKNTTISDEIDSLTDYSNRITQKVFDKGQGVYVKNMFLPQNVNLGDHFTSNLKNLNSQFGIDIYQLRSIYLNDKLLVNGRDYFVNHTSSKNTFGSVATTSTFSQKFYDKGNYLAECYYQTGNITFSSARIQDFSYHEVNKFRTGSFALRDKQAGIVYFYYQNDQLKVREFNDFYKAGKIDIGLGNLRFSKLWIIDQPYTFTNFLVAMTEDKILYFFELIISSFGELFNIYFHTKLDFIPGTGISEVTAVGYYNENIIVGTNLGLYIYEQLTFEPVATRRLQDVSSSADNTQVPGENSPTATSQSSTTETTDSTASITVTASQAASSTTSVKETVDTKPNTTESQTSPVVITADREKSYKQIRKIITYKTKYGLNEILNISDLSVLQYTMYILVRGYGIKIMELKSFGFLENYEFYYKMLSKLDFVVNPILNTKYMAITIKESRNENNDEFMLELCVDDEYNPKINKVFVSDYNITFTNYSPYDLFLGAYYNAYENDLIIVRRGMINNIPFQTYVISLDDLFKPSNSSEVYITSFYNSITNLNELALVDTTDNIVRLISNIKLPSDVIDCKFNTKGNFTIVLQKFAEACEDSLSKNYAYSYCNFGVYLPYYVIGEDMTDLTIMGIVLGSLFGFLILVILIFLTFKTQCCTDFSMFKKRGNSGPTREELYRDNFLTQKGKFQYNPEQSVNHTFVSKNIVATEVNMGTKGSRFGNQ